MGSFGDRDSRCITSGSVEPPQRDQQQNGTERVWAVEIEVPRDRAGIFDPQLPARLVAHRWDGCEDSVGVRPGNGGREIQDHLKDLYATDISADHPSVGGVGPLVATAIVASIVE